VRAVAYAREFHGLSADESVDHQAERLERFIRERGWDLIAVRREADEGLPVLESVLAQVSEFDRLVVTRLDRIGRRLRRISRLVAQLQQAGVQLVTLDEGLDTSSPEWTPASKLVSVMATWEEPIRSEPFPSWDVSALQAWGFTPKTVIDVGAAAGTPELYQAFPSAHHVLIEPLEEFEDALATLAQELGGDYVPTAVGSAEGRAPIRVEGRLGMSSLLDSLTGPPSIDRREIPITTLDKLLNNRNWAPPFGLKIDTEGFESEVINGAPAVLENTQFVIAELSVSRRFEDAPSCSEFIELMRSRGFEVRDIIDARPSPLGTFADGLFARLET
jgi:FkbM family methyltransferase